MKPRASARCNGLQATPEVAAAGFSELDVINAVQINAAQLDYRLGGMRA
jgi:hypothetical protein